MVNVTVKNKSKTKFIKCLLEETGGNISEACKLVGFSRQTINEWRHIDDNFDQSVDEAILAGKDTLADLAETYLQKRIREGDTTAIIFTLKSLRRTFYGERLEVTTQKNDLNVANPSLKPGFTNTLLRLGLQTASLNLLNPNQKQQLQDILETLKMNQSVIINEDDRS